MKNKVLKKILMAMLTATVALSVGVSDTWQNMLRRKNMMKNIQNGNLMICRLFQIYGRCRCLKTRKNSLKYYAD